MTDTQKQQILGYRDIGYGYTKIAQMMGIPVNTVKTFCKRHGLGGKMAAQNALTGLATTHCETCGKPVLQHPHRKKKRFCSDRCRMAWWSEHQDQVNRKAIYEFICKKYKKPFVAYGNDHRKYCCRECYMNDRFGGGAL